MIQHVHHSSKHHATASTASSATSKKSADTDSFSALFASSSAQPAAATSTSSSTQISTTITKPADTKPTVTLTPPHYQTDTTVANPDGTTTQANWTEFAAPTTADQIAAKLGGTVVKSNAGYSNDQLNIQVPGASVLLNAGQVAHLFSIWGDQKGSMAWQVINNDLGRDPMAT